MEAVQSMDNARFEGQDAQALKDCDEQIRVKNDGRPPCDFTHKPHPYTVPEYCEQPACTGRNGREVLCVCPIWYDENFKLVLAQDI